MLKGKKVLLGVTGSISIYKSLDLVRLYKKANAEVRVIMSDSAMKFITPLTFESLTSHKVLISSTESWADINNHISITRWADIFVIAPATANTINKLSNGIADNLLTQAALAYRGRKVIAPAANTNMYKNSTTQASIKMLKLINYEVVEPVKKELACGEIGDGALADVSDIFYKSASILLEDEFWKNRRVVVTGGGTIEKIDDVRYISNFSSGKMANALSTALYLKGADVCLITTKNSKDIPSEIYTIDVKSSNELKEYLVDAIRVAKKGVLTKPTLMDDSVPQLIQKKPFLFMAAAVSDFVVKYPQSGKIKKENISDNWDLQLVKNIDILASIDKSGIYGVGFKAEMDKKSGENSAKKMLDEKNLDAVLLNFVSDYGFGSDKNKLTIITENEKIDLESDFKFEISMRLLDNLAKVFKVDT